MAKKIDCSLKKNLNNSKCKKAVGEAVFSIIIPKGDNSNNQINKRTISKHIKKISNRFGGTTTRPITLGCWTDDKRGELQCETGLQVYSFVDFDSPYNTALKKLDVIQRKDKLQKDYKFMKRISKEIAKEFGQDSIPVIYDNVKDISFIQGSWKKKLNKKFLTGKKTPKNPFKKYI